MAEETVKQKSGPSLVMWLILLLVLSLIAAGAGGGLGIVVYSMAEKSTMSMAATDPEPEKVENYASGEQVQALPPVVTNLASPPDTWVRLEGTVVFTSKSETPRDELVHKIAGDVLAYIRSLTLSQLRGGAGLLHLREDLSERARLRSGGAAKEIIVHSLVIE